MGDGGKMELNEKTSRILLKPLYEAIKENNFEKVNYLLTGCDDSPNCIKKLLKFNQVPDKRNNPLNLALKSGSSDSILKVLLESGADPNEHVLHSPFLLAIRRKDLKSIKMFMKYGGDPFKSINIIMTATNKKYYDEDIVNSIVQFGAKMKLKSTRKRYLILTRGLSLGNGPLIETSLTNFREISRSTYVCHLASNRMISRSPITDLINSRSDTADLFKFYVSDTNYKEMLRLVNLVYKMMSREDRQQALHDINHGIYWENRRFPTVADSHYEFLDRLNQDILEMMMEDLKCDFDVNSIAFCKQQRISPPGNDQNLLVCAFRYSNQVLAEKLIKLGADLSLVQFEDLSLIYRLESRDKLMKLLVAAGYRLPYNFDIREFLSNTDFGDYVCWTGQFVDYYIDEKLIYLYRLYKTLVPQHQFNLQSLSRMSLIKYYHPYTQKVIFDKLPPKLKKYMSFNDCDS